MLVDSCCEEFMSKIEDFLKKKKILIVDDESFMRTILNSVLKHIGFSGISEARDGKSALSMLKANKFDICLCDWEMPGVNGVDLFKEIQGSEELKDLIFVMITSHAEADKVQEAKEVGIKEYITKPFNENVIRKKLVKLLSEQL